MSNPFYTSDEIDDDEFLKHPKAGSSGYILPNHPAASRGTVSPMNPSSRDQNDRLMQLQEQRREIERRTLDSSHNSLGLLYESEKVGLATAEELQRQKEQLKQTEERLDEINSTLNNSERHLNGMKSIFGGIRNYLFAKRSGVPQTGTQSTSLEPPLSAVQSNSSKLEQPSNFGGAQSSNNSYHPGLRTRGRIETDATSSVDDILDKNLDQMSLGLSRLKNLAAGLNDELDEHNELLDRLDHKIDKTDWRVKKQNQDMDKLLKK